MMNKEHVLSEIKRTAEENGGVPLGRERFERITGIKQWDWLGKYWSRWNDAIVEAGYAPNRMQSAYSDEFIIQKLLELIRELGHFPTVAELRVKAHHTNGFPAHNTFAKFGNKHGLIQAALKYCKKHDVEDDIFAICKAAAAMSKPRQRQKTIDEELEYGFVYLMKSGRHFKIGRSNCAERREFELRILLPERLELVHKIKTDDPVGIERYWHERFKGNRTRGEWFDLSAADVKAFKRRKFM